MASLCNDCGKAFDGDAKAHFDSSHPGSERFRFRASDGVSHLVCAACGKDVVDGTHLEKTTGETRSGKSFDPKDYFALHVEGHRSGL